VTRIRIETETEIAAGWTFVALLGVEPDPRRCRVSLSWADYDLWSGGDVAPEEVVRAVLEFVLERRSAAEVPERFDAALVRRWYRDADRELGGRV